MGVYSISYILIILFTIVFLLFFLKYYCPLEISVWPSANDKHFFFFQLFE